MQLMLSQKDGRRPKPRNSSDNIDRMRGQLERILDWVEEAKSRDQTPAERVSRLRGEEKIPIAIATHMQIVLTGDGSANGNLGDVQKAWKAVTHWATGQGFKLSS
jgi:hypothetical protein